MPRAGFRSRLLSATALACTTASFAGAARAACVEHPVDPVVRCNGNVPNGFAAPGSDNLLVEVGNGANIGPIPGQSPSAAITFNLNTADKELTIASGSSLYGGAVRSDSNSGTIGVWNLNPNLFAGVALGAAGDTGTNQVVNQAGGSLGPSSLTGDGGNSFDNAGSTSGPMTIAGDGTNDVINRVGASTSGLLALSGDGQNRVDNSGDFSNGLRITGSGSNAIANRVGATIRSTFTVTGDGRSIVFNWGTLTNGYTSTGAAVDLFLNRGSISTDVNLGAGNDRFQIVEGNMTNNALLGDGDDYALISGGNIANSVSGGAGEDVVDWTGGTIGALLMGPGEDLATLTGLSQDELKFIPLDGGPDAIDRMVWSGTLGTNVSRITNWELIELNDGSELIHNGTLTLGDAGVGTGRLVIDPTSTMFAYGFTRSIVPGGAGQLVTVTNQGTIDLVDPTGTPSYPQDRLTITGDFYGDAATARAWCGSTPTSATTPRPPTA